jgi:hypothetical protein
MFTAVEAVAVLLLEIPLVQVVVVAVQQERLGT